MSDFFSPSGPPRSNQPTPERPSSNRPTANVPKSNAPKSLQQGTVFQSEIEETKEQGFNPQEFNSVLVKGLSTNMFGQLSGLGSLLGGAMAAGANLQGITAEELLKSLSDGSFDKFGLNFSSIGGVFDKVKGVMAKIKAGDITGLMTDMLSDLTGGRFQPLSRVQNLLAGELSGLPQPASSLLMAASNVGFNFVSSLAGSLFDVIVSRIYLPEAIYLLTIKGMKEIGGDPYFNNRYVRNVMLKKDHLDVIKWMDGLYNTSYSIFQYPHRRYDGIMASENGSIRIVSYILNLLRTDTIEFQSNYNDAKDDYNAIKDEEEKAKEKIKKAEKDIVGYSRTIKNKNSTESQKETAKEHKSVSENLIKTSKNVISYVNQKKMDMNNAKMMVDVYGRQTNYMIAQLIKNLIVYGYTNITVYDIANLLTTYNIAPKIFGTTDDLYSQRFLITDNDLNIMAPIKEEKNIESSLLTTEFTRVGGFGFKDSPIKYITPRNYNIKKIYIYLSSEQIHGENRMVNEKFYERMTLPIYTDVTKALSDALPNFNLPFLKTSSTIYDFTKTMENILKDQSKIKYLNLADTDKIKPLTQKEVGEVKTVTKDDVLTDFFKAQNDDKKKDENIKMTTGPNDELFDLTPRPIIKINKDLFKDKRGYDIDIDHPEANGYVESEINILKKVNNGLESGKSLKDIVKDDFVDTLNNEFFNPNPKNWMIIQM